MRTDFTRARSSSLICCEAAQPARRAAARRAMAFFMLVSVDSEIRREQSRGSIAQLNRQRARVGLGERVGARLPDAGLDHGVEVRAELDAVALDVELEVEPQAARVPVRR